MEELFRAFAISPDTLRVYDGPKLIFSSRKDRLAPILEYLGLSLQPKEVTVFDRIAGNAAALLAVKAGARAVWSPLGSRNAVRTLGGFGVEARFTALVDAILKPDSSEMCPMERLSLGRNPEEFYNLLTREKAAGGNTVGGC